jgi:hypothetical protein
VASFDPEATVRILNKHGVRYVVIGGIAAQLHDLPVPATVDIDVTPALDLKNLESLANAFDELEAGLYSVDEGATWFPRRPVENWAQYASLHLMTKFGPVDIVFRPDGAANGFADVLRDAEESMLGEEPVLVIATATWVALKQAAGRQKDIEHLDQYFQHLES